MTGGGGGPAGNEGAGQGWPVRLAGVTETVVATPTPDGDWAVAALGLRPGDPVTARTFGRTRTRRGFERAVDAGRTTAPTDSVGDGSTNGSSSNPAPPVIQFVDDPVAFVRAALGRWTAPEPVVDAAAAWVPAGVERRGSERDGGIEVVTWELHPGPATVDRRTVPTIGRGFNAVVEATVAASRLDVPAYDPDALRERLDHLAGVVERCGGERDRAAMDRVATLVDGWDPHPPER